MSAGSVASSRRGAVAELCVTNPSKFNAMSLAMWRQLAEQVRALDAEASDGRIRVLVLRGDGDKAFVSGADIAEFATTRSAESGSEAYDRAVDEAQAALLALRIPTVARLRGICMGGGLGLAMACDLRYANEGATIRMPAARLGLGYSIAGMQRMVAVLGPSVVADLFMTARALDGREAERLGIATRTHADLSFDAEFERTVGAVASNAPLTLRLAKAVIGLGTDTPGAARLAELDAERLHCVASDDYREGRRAFAEKRAPVFTGR